MLILTVVIQLMILATLWGILAALKSGFNEVIRGIEAVHRDPGSTRRG